ncbi:MAG TPA: hypothetical protein VNF68_00070 [Candidatus Baltobacteraceae bacterium]|nr:hypothetical protein [Candidatus Baltobacteraceae bacterium]
MLLSIVAATLVATSPVPTLASGNYTYNATMNGANVGTSQITVKSSGSGIEIDEQMKGSFQGSASTGNATYNLAADLSPQKYAASGTIGGDTVNDAAVITGNAATVSTGQGGSQSFTLSPPATRFVVVDLGAFAGFMPLAAQMNAWNDPKATVLVPMYGIALSIEIAGNTATRPAAVPASDLAMSFGGNAPFTIWYDPATYIPDEIDIPSQSVVVTRQH